MSGILWLIAWGAFIFLMMRFGCGAHVMGHDGDSDRAGREKTPLWVPPETDTDPVCEKTVKTVNARSSVFNGHVYYFCSRECREIFEAAPETYVAGNADAPMKQLENSHA